MIDSEPPVVIVPHASPGRPWSSASVMLTTSTSILRSDGKMVG
jgi:hypothetical protein